MAAQCPGKRHIPELMTLNNEELAAWHTRRNQCQKDVVYVL
jgi:hypothetical protein